MDVLKSLAEAEPVPYWLTDPARPEPEPALVGPVTCDLAVVGGGYSGLWTALMAKERDPSLDVVVLEADRIGGAASGRNGGFCSASLTHGLGNGLERWPGEIAALERLGRDNLDGIERTLARYGIDAEFERTGELDVATAPWQLDDLAELAEAARGLGQDMTLLDAEQVRAEVDSPTYVGGLWDKDGTAMLHPAKLAWGLAEACRSLGVRIHERTPVRSLTDRSGRFGLVTPYGRVSAAKVALGTGVFPPLLKRLRHYLVPVYDYALMTEPLSAEQLASIGWRHRQGLADSANQFHYYRLTADNRILWGGYDAVYHYGNGIRAELERRPATFATLARHFFQTFPQLEGLRFTHAWGGVIDTCSRFCAFFGTAHRGRLAYAAGYTGLGVGATRFGAAVMLDLLSGEDTERTRLQMVRNKPIPFPPEPLRYAGIQLTRRSIARADRDRGRRDLWLRTLDRLGLGFDS
ncbi:NAD(P)/FAD-dependent oxidoreductase [Thermomonospora cellulosilytica]|uniref:Glycine/D-amino acid oxidase-like deaminating enzyme n=1 Tax=Thermomonospora cellulosilytica TaxID=1411118 RepID=A0A7W3RBN5_9ACTN|nr:FAD-dependent oxidoreductase [Thermomonospora cellulosilytica]MBA9007081.1 glycine/D-amino acid oxidase-like deaminating enzyme [Thermomonospora cellulosilytica]